MKKLQFLTAIAGFVVAMIGLVSTNTAGSKSAVWVQDPVTQRCQPSALPFECINGPGPVCVVNGQTLFKNRICTVAYHERIK